MPSVATAVAWTLLSTYAIVRACDDLRVGAFNIQVFGKSKISKLYVVDVLERISKRYDLLFIQELRDVSGVAISTLVDAVNSSSRPYGLQISERLGRTNSKEQYVFLYRQDKLQVRTAFVYNDSVSDVFEREPFVVEFAGTGDYKSCMRPFSVIGCHVQPSNVAMELSRLVLVYNHTVARINNANSIIMGDFNADCSYLPKKEFPSVQLMIDTRFTWLINETADTTVAASSCAYDRLIVAGDWLPGEVVDGSVSVFRFDIEYNLNASVTREVSDHYPVEMTLATEPFSSPTSTQGQASVSTQGPALSTTSGSSSWRATLTQGQAFSASTQSPALSTTSATSSWKATLTRGQAFSASTQGPALSTSAASSCKAGVRDATVLVLPTILLTAVERIRN